ncbi:Nuclear pore complex subunit [Giardia muris]|uniref:Nuclear pore complex subunit n=1 Tax=Giardia muris TaxID=5742 RepID=A0A4Z1T3G3_GIAMU|nr:Nuclear pore complex subunit [Giardia muris]|eukprot:TNJ30188.1 Nuclear pore complex subunit [Giardia muris]
MSASQTIDLLHACKEIYERDTLIPDLDIVGTKLTGTLLGAGSAEQVFEKQHVFELPPALVERTKLAGDQVRMGFLRDIGYVWVAIDRDLALLEFEGSGRIVRLEMPETVQYCAAFVPAVGAFSANARYLLAVATTGAVTLYAFIYPQQSATLDNTVVDATVRASGATARQAHAWPPTSGRNASSSRFVLSETGLSAALPSGATVTQLVTTDTGRLFAGLTNGALLELIYTTDAGSTLTDGLLATFRSTEQRALGNAALGHARLIDRTSIPILSSVPFIGSLVAQRPIKQCVYDETRGLLYTLHEDDRISPHLLDGSCVHSFQRLKPYTSLATDLKGLLPEETRIVQISPITRRESASLCLQAMLENGYLVYFGLSTALPLRESLQMEPELIRDFVATGRSGGANGTSLDKVSLAKARLAYRDCRRPLEVARTTQGGRCASFYSSRGVLLASFYDELGTRTRVYGAAQELAPQTRAPRTLVQELVDLLPREQPDAQVVEVAEYTPSDTAPLILADCLSASPPLYQYIRGPRTIVVVTTAAIVSYRVLAPAHRVGQLIARPAELARFRETFDITEYQCMLLHAAVESVLSTGLPTAQECAALFFQGMKAPSCTQHIALRRYVARVLSYLSVYPYWRGVSSGGTGPEPEKGGSKRPQSRAFAFLQRLPVDDAGRTTTRSSSKPAPKARAVSVSHFQTRSTAASLLGATAGLSSGAGAATVTSLIWSSEDLAHVADRLRALHAFIGAHAGEIAAYDASVNPSESFGVVYQCIWNIQQTVRFLSLALQPAHLVYTGGVFNRFAREHGKPILFQGGRGGSGTKTTEPAGQYCELLTVAGFFEPDAKVMIDEVLRVLSVGEMVPAARGSLLCATTIRKAIGANFMDQLQMECPDLFNVYSTRLSVLRQLEGTRTLPPELRTKQIREALSRMLAVPQAIDPVEPVIVTLRSLDQYASAVLLLLRSTTAEEVKICDAFLTENKDQLSQLALIHAHSGHPGHTGTQSAALSGQLFSNTAKTLSQTLEQALLTNRDQAFGYYRSISLPPASTQLIERFREVREGLRDGSVCFPFVIENGFSQILQKESILAGLDSDVFRLAILKVCRVYSRALDLVLDGYLLAGIEDQLVAAQQRTGTGVTASGVGAGAGSAHGLVLAVIESAVRHSLSRVWQYQLYAFLYFYYYTCACLLKALRDGAPTHTATYGATGDVIFVLKTVQTRAEQALVLISSPFIEEFLHAHDYMLHARFLERRKRQLEASTILYRRATAQKQPALFPSIYNGTVRNDFLTLEERIDLLNEASARLEYALLADARGSAYGLQGSSAGPSIGIGTATSLTTNRIGSTTTGPTINMQDKVYPVYANPEGIEDLQATPQHLLKAIKDALTAASVQLLLLQRVRRLPDDGREKYAAELDTEGLLSMSVMRTKVINPLKFCDMAVYMLLSNQMNANCRAELANQWIGALTGKLGGFSYTETQLIAESPGGPGLLRASGMGDEDVLAANSVIRAAQVLRFILGMCASTEHTLQPGDYTIPLAVLALIVTSNYREYDVRNPYDHIARYFVETLFAPGGPAIRENVVLANILSGIDLVWKVLAPYEALPPGGMNTQNLMEALPIPDLGRCSLLYLSRVLGHYGLALVARARALNNMVADPLAQIVNLETIQHHARQILER